MKRFNDYYMSLAKLSAEMSYAEKLKVGAVIVKDGRILSTSWNGTPSGWSNRCEVLGKTKPEVIHAEANAILKVARSHDSTEGATMYCTHSPCMECAKMIRQSGIVALYYAVPFNKQEGLQFLKSCGALVNLWSQDEK